MNPTNHSTFLIHAIFSTREQKPFITEKIEPFLYDKISKILYDECYSPALIIGGDVEHIHFIYAQSRVLSVDDVINRVKERSAEFMKKRNADFAWQENYCAVTISRSEDEIGKKYIADQKEFHKTTSYKDEIREILQRHEIDFDEKEVWE